VTSRNRAGGAGEKFKALGYPGAFARWRRSRFADPAFRELLKALAGGGLCLE